MSIANPTPAERVNQILVLLTNQIGANFYDFSEVLKERENLDVLDDVVFNTIAGQVVRVASLYRKSDIKILSPRNENSSRTKEELDIICNYLSTLLVRRLFIHHDDMLEAVTDVLASTHQTWDSSFKSLMHLIVLFDFSREKSGYRDLVIPLADACVQLIHEYYGEDDAT